MLRAVHSSLLLPLIKTQIKRIGCVQYVKSHTNVNSIRLYTTNFNVQTWSESLDEANQKRIRHIQNEVVE